ncbi:MAG: hypothetical protein J7497_16990 [Chitinophagaceae bacterium]|nr:hypothetical protein [Chitinophagaceae bacterium]
MNMLKTRLIYLKIKRNQVEVTDLNTDRTVFRQAIEPFSSVRMVVSSFDKANAVILSAFEDLGIKSGFFRPLTKILVQQLEGIEGGLADIEKRALRDLAEMAGANKVFILEETEPVTNELALTYLNQI